MALLDHLVDLFFKVGFPSVVAGWLLVRHEQLERESLQSLALIQKLLEELLRKGCGNG